MSQVKLIPELLCSNLSKSMDFYISLLGFSLVYERPEEGFAFLNLNDAKLMLEEVKADKGDRIWWTGAAEKPFGRGVNFQIEVDDVDAIEGRLKVAKHPLFRQIEEKWYRVGKAEEGNRQFLVQDPDGYLLRFFQDLGTRVLNSNQA